LAGMEELFRSTKVEALPIGLWPKLFSVTSNAEPGFNWFGFGSHNGLYVILGFRVLGLGITTIWVSVVFGASAAASPSATSSSSTAVGTGSMNLGFRV